MLHSVKPVSLTKRLICVLLVLALMAVMFPLLGAAYEEKTGYIASDATPYVNVRKGPGTSYDYAGSIYPNESLTIIGEDKASDGYTWYNITYSGGTGWVRSDYVIVNYDYETDPAFEAYLDEQGFPESYKDGLRQLHAQYPNWVFKAMHVNYLLPERVF